MRARASKADKALDQAIETAYYACGQGVQINMLDIPRIFAAGRAAAASGGSVEEAVRAAVAQYRLN